MWGSAELCTGGLHLGSPCSPSSCTQTSQPLALHTQRPQPDWGEGLCWPRLQKVWLSLVLCVCVCVCNLSNAFLCLFRMCRIGVERKKHFCQIFFYFTLQVSRFFFPPSQRNLENPAGSIRNWNLSTSAYSFTWWCDTVGHTRWCFCCILL